MSRLKYLNNPKSKISSVFILMILVAGISVFLQTTLITPVSAQSYFSETIVPPTCRVVPVTWGGGLDIRGYDFSTPKQRMLPGQMVAFRKEWSDSHTPWDAGTEYDDLDSKIISVSAKPCDFSSPELVTNKCIVTNSYGGARIRTTDNIVKNPSSCKLPPAGTVTYYSLKINELWNNSLNNCPQYHGNCEFYFFYH